MSDRELDGRGGSDVGTGGGRLREDPVLLALLLHPLPAHDHPAVVRGEQLSGDGHLLTANVGDGTVRLRGLDEELPARARGRRTHGGSSSKVARETPEDVAGIARLVDGKGGIRIVEPDEVPRPNRDGYRRIRMD